MYFNNSSSSYQPYQSVGSLSMVSLSQIREEENLDYLQNLCGFIDQMNLNPLWFESQTAGQKLKVLEIYQTAINYSKNLSQAYGKQLLTLEQSSSRIRQQNEEKEKQIRLHKDKVCKLKAQLKIKKHKIYRAMYSELKHKLKEEEERRHSRRDHEESRSSADRTEVVYYPMPQNNYYPYPSNQRPPYPPPYQEPYQNHQPRVPPSVPPPGYFQPQQRQEHGPFGNIPNLADKFREHIEKEVSNPSIPASSGHAKTEEVLITKKIDKSLIIEAKDEEVEEQSSEIIKKDIISDDISSAKKSSLNLKGESKRRVSIENIRQEDDFGELAERSRKSSSTAKKLDEPQSTSSLEQKEIDSIINLKMFQQSSNSKKDQFHSKVIRLQQSKVPIDKISEIKEDEEEMALSLPGESRMNNKNKIKDQNLLKPSSQIDKKKMKDSNTSSDIGISRLKTSNFSAQRPTEDIPPPVFRKPLVRRRDDAAAVRDRSNHDSDSSLQNFDLVADSNIGKGKQDYTGIKNSTRISKLRGNQNDPVIEVGQNYPPEAQPQKTPQIKGTDNKGSEDYSNIERSNMGLSPSGSENTSEKLFKKGLVRNEKNNKEESNLSAGSKQSEEKKEIIQEDNYEEQDFQEFDTAKLESSHYPHASKKEGRKEETKIDRREVKIEKSIVSIDVSSAQTITEKTKFFRIKDEEFKVKLKDNLFGKTQKSNTLIQESQDPFDFIDNMPANSVIAKRPFLKSQLIPQSRDPQKKTSISIKNFPQSEQKQSDNLYSINVISDGKQKQKLLSRDQHQRSNSGQKRPEKAVVEDNLVAIGAVLQSKPPYQVQKDESLEMMGVAGVLQSKVDKKKGSLVDLNSVDQKKDSKEIQNKLQDSDSQLIIDIEDQNGANMKVDSDTLRLRILKMAQNVNQVRPSKVDRSKFSIKKKIDEVLKNVCKFTSLDTTDVSKIEQTKLMLEREIKKVRVEGERKRDKIQEALVEQKLKLQTPPKLNSPLNGDSLLYSYSQFNQRPKSGSKRVQNKEKEAVRDFTQSLEFQNIEGKSYPYNPLVSKVANNPYTPEMSRNPYTPEESKVKIDKIPKEGMIRPVQSKQADFGRGENNFLISNNKSIGTKEQAQLFKYVGQGIGKYDKDDPLNSPLGQFVERHKKKQTDEDYSDDEEWA